MKLRFRKILAFTLMLAITLLPMPSVFAMQMASPAPVAGEHCHEMMAHADGAMTADMAVKQDTKDQTVSCKCCGQCDGDCMGCTTMTAITFELFQLATSASSEIYRSSFQSFNTRNTSPPSRPPLSLLL